MEREEGREAESLGLGVARVRGVERGEAAIDDAGCEFTVQPRPREGSLEAIERECAGEFALASRGEGIGARVVVPLAFELGVEVRDAVGAVAAESERALGFGGPDDEDEEGEDDIDLDDELVAGDSDDEAGESEMSQDAAVNASAIEQELLAAAADGDQDDDDEEGEEEIDDDEGEEGDDKSYGDEVADEDIDTNI